MENLIIIPEQKLIEILRREISSLFPTTPITHVKPKKMGVKEASTFLFSIGYPTSISKLYKLTAENLIPHAVYGKKLVFDCEEVEKWASAQAIKKASREEAIISLMEEAKRKGGKK